VFRNVHPTEGLDSGVDCSVTVFAGGGEGGEGGGGGVERIEEVGLAEETLEG